MEKDILHINGNEYELTEPSVIRMAALAIGSIDQCLQEELHKIIDNEGEN